MYDDRTDPADAELVAALRATFLTRTPPVAGSDLRALFDGVITPRNPALARSAAPTQRRRPMVLEAFKSLPSKISAAALGAAITIGGLGAAGALPGAMMLTSNEADAAVEACDDVSTEPAVDEAAEGTDTEGTDTEGTDTEGTEAEGTEAEGTDDSSVEESAGDEAATDDDGVESESCEAEDEAEGETGSTDDDEVAATDEDDASEDGTDVTSLGEVAVPTSVSEAAHTHAFDEACGNHGKYVSHFARYGEEPECATEARAAASGDADEPAGDDTAAPAVAEDSGDAEVRNPGQAKKGDAGKAKAASSKGKGKGGRR